MKKVCTYLKDEFSNFDKRKQRNVILDLIFELKFRSPKKSQYLKKIILSKFDQNHYKDSSFRLFEDLYQILNSSEVIRTKTIDNSKKFTYKERKYMELIISFIKNIRNTKINQQNQLKIFFAFSVSLFVITGLISTFENTKKVVNKSVPSTNDKNTFREKTTNTSQKPIKSLSLAEKYQKDKTESALKYRNEQKICKYYLRNAQIRSPYDDIGSTRYHIGWDEKKAIVSEVSGSNTSSTEKDGIHCMLKKQRELDKEYRYGNYGDIELFTIENDDLIRYVKRGDKIQKYNLSNLDGIWGQRVEGFFDLFR